MQPYHSDKQIILIVMRILGVLPPKATPPPKKQKAFLRDKKTHWFPLCPNTIGAGHAFQGCLDPRPTSFGTHVCSEKGTGTQRFRQNQAIAWQPMVEVGVGGWGGWRWGCCGLVPIKTYRFGNLGFGDWIAWTSEPGWLKFFLIDIMQTQFHLASSKTSSSP